MSCFLASTSRPPSTTLASLSLQLTKACWSFEFLKETGLAEDSRGALLLLFDFYRTTIKSFNGFTVSLLCTIIFDHGHGISTLYMHMKDINVKSGQKVKQGQIVGTLGQSGRATGPHLDITLLE